MAPRILQYEGGAERVMQVQPMEDAALKETRNMMGTISDAVSQMAKFSFEQESREAKQRGMQRVADEGAQPVLSAMQQAGGPRTIEDRAAVETANRIASAELETQAILEMNQVLSAAEQQELSLEDFQAKLADVTDGIPASLSDLNPLLAGELQAKLNSKAGIYTQSYADWYHKKAMQDARGRALVGIDTRQQTIYQLAASNSPDEGIRLAVIDAELKNLQFYMQDLQFSEEQVSKIFLETRGKAIEEGIRFDFSQLGSVQEQMKFISKLEKSPPKAIGRDASRKIATTLRTQMNTGVKVLKGQAKSVSDRITDLSKVIEGGGQVDGGVLIKLETELASLDGVIDPSTGDPINLSARKELQELKTVETILSAYRQSSPEEAQRSLDQLQSGISGAGGPGIDTVLEVKARDAAQNFITTTRANLKKDGMTHAQTVGLVQPSAIAFGGSPEELFSSIEKRRQDYQTVTSAYPAYNIGPLREGEVQIVANSLENGTIQTQMETLGAIVQGFRQDSPAVLEQISKDAPVFAHVGGLMLMGKTKTARKILEGIALGKEGGPMPADITRTDIDLLFHETIGSSLNEQSAAVTGAAYEATMAIFRSNMSRGGKVNVKAAGDKEMQVAINLALGGDGNLDSDGLGGVRTVRDRQVLLPPYLSADGMEKLIENLTPEKFKLATGRDVDPAILNEIKENENIFPQAVGDDSYVLIHGTKDSPNFIKVLGADDEPFEINMRVLWGKEPLL
jgi:hypothetical protein